MTQKEFNNLTFSQRHEISKGTKCNASWQVRTIGGSAAYAISCRECGTVLQSDCTPKCLLLHPPLTDVNPHVVRPALEIVSEGEPLATEGEAQSQSEDIYCFCANGGREGLNGICTNCGNYVARSSCEGALWSWRWLMAHNNCVYATSAVITAAKRFLFD